MFPGKHRPKRRVVIFIDVQNIHGRLREAFGRKPAPYADGQFDPMALASLIIGRAPAGEMWELSEVRAYVGRPSPTREPKAAAAHTRQMATWGAAGVTIRPRDLQYINWPVEPPRQKGVDVEMANDIYRMADERYDIGIVCSFDTDMVPALDALYEKRGSGGTPRVCVLGLAGDPRRLRLSDTRGRRLYCFYLDGADYLAIHDPTDYTAEASDPS